MISIRSTLVTAPAARWDFPQLGHDSQALIFTANVYNAAGVYIDSRMFAVAKSLVYNGPSQALNPYIFTRLVGTLAPPLVLDNNPKTFSGGG